MNTRPMISRRIFIYPRDTGDIRLRASSDFTPMLILAGCEFQLIAIIIAMTRLGSDAPASSSPAADGTVREPPPPATLFCLSTLGAICEAADTLYTTILLPPILRFVLTRLLLACTIVVVIGMFIFVATVYPDQLVVPSDHQSDVERGTDRCRGDNSAASRAAESAKQAGDSRDATGSQRAVVQKARPGIMTLSLMTAATFAYVQYAAWAVAMGRATGGLSSLIIVEPLISVALIPALVLPVRRELRRQQAALGRP